MFAWQDDPMRGSSLQLHGATLEIYRILSDLKGGRVGAVQKALQDSGRELAYTTVQTVLNRLEDRGFVETSRDGNAIVYRPLIPLARIRRARVKTLVDELYRDDVGSLVLQLVQTRSLSDQDLEELRLLVEEHEAKRKRRSGR